MTTTTAPVLQWDRTTQHEGACESCMSLQTVCTVRITVSGKTVTICSSCSIWLLDALTP